MAEFNTAVGQNNNLLLIIIINKLKFPIVQWKQSTRTLPANSCKCMKALQYPYFLTGRVEITRVLYFVEKILYNIHIFLQLKP